MTRAKYKQKRLVASMFTPYVGLLITTATIIILSAILTDWTTKEPAIEFAKNWTLSDGSDADLTEIRDDVSFYNTLPELHDNNEALTFQVKNIIVSVYIDNILIKDYKDLEMSPDLFYKAPGKYAVQIPLKQEDSGKIVEIKVQSPYKNDSSCNIKNIKIGNVSNIIKEEVTNNLFTYSVCLILICTGIVFIILAKALRNYNKNNNNLLYLGTFTLVVGIWAMSDISLLQFLSDNSSFWHVITGLTLPLTTTPLFLFFKQGYKTTSMFPVLCINITTILIYITVLILHVTRIADIHETLILSHINITISAIFTIYYAIRIFIESKFKDISFWGMIAIAICAISDIILYKSQITSDNSVSIRVGMVIYIWCLGVGIIRDYIKTYNTYLKTELLAKAAYFDVLTDFYNRTSWIENTRNLNPNNSAIVIFDMNNLKYINDIHGHTNGDNAIIESADYIKIEFGSYGKCYRIGGDEFVFMSEKPMTEEEVKKHATNLEMKLCERNKSLPQDHPWPLLIATGYAILNEENVDFKTAFEKADKMMYANKQLLKQRYPEMNLRK